MAYFMEKVEQRLPVGLFIRGGWHQGAGAGGQPGQANFHSVKNPNLVNLYLINYLNTE